MVEKTLLTEMSEVVAQLVLEGHSYKKAFAEVAHKNNIWHHQDKEQYNYHFRQVMKRVKIIIGRGNLSQACKKKPQPKQDPTRQIPLRLAANDRD